MNIKNISAFILIIIAIFFGIWYLSGSNSGSQGSLSSLTTTTASPQSSSAQYIYTLLQQMAQVKLDDSVFQDSVFKRLQDNTVTLSAQPTGRDNPFAPVGSITVISQAPSNTISTSSTIR